MADGNPVLLKIPQHFRTVDDVLGCAAKMELPNIALVSERDDGSLVLLCDGEMTLAQVNWLLDRLKMLLLTKDHRG